MLHFFVLCTCLPCDQALPYLVVSNILRLCSVQSCECFQKCSCVSCASSVVFNYNQVKLRFPEELVPTRLQMFWRFSNRYTSSSKSLHSKYQIESKYSWVQQQQIQMNYVSVIFSAF